MVLVYRNHLLFIFFLLSTRAAFTSSLLKHMASNLEIENSQANDSTVLLYRESTCPTCSKSTFERALHSIDAGKILSAQSPDGFFVGLDSESPDENCISVAYKEEELATLCVKLSPVGSPDFYPIKFTQRLSALPIGMKVRKENKLILSAELSKYANKITAEQFADKNFLNQLPFYPDTGSKIFRYAPLSAAFFSQMLLDLEEKNSSYLQIPNAPGSFRIPAIMHQVWFGADLPLKYQKLRRTWLKKNPGWQYICWTGHNLTRAFPKRLFNQELFDLAKSQGIFSRMSNVVRYEVVNKYGGMYADSDMLCLEPFDRLHKALDGYASLELDLFPSFICNNIFGSVPESRLLAEGMAALYEIYHDEYKVIITQGPTSITRALLSLYEKDGSNQRLMIFPDCYLNFHTGCGCQSICALSRHLFAGNWSGKKNEDLFATSAQGVSLNRENFQLYPNF